MLQVLYPRQFLSTKKHFISTTKIATIMHMIKQTPDFSIEIATGAKLVAGADEAGRGPLCGPVVAAAVIFPRHDIDIPVIIRDSKQMTPAQRAKAYNWITNNTIWAVAECSPAEIDELNILWASMLAMRRAIDKLQHTPDYCLIDGNRLPHDITGTTIVHGDAKSISIAAASIIAKETRDSIMRNLSQQFPQYGWEKNAGYPTKSHLHAIDKYGINEHYRKSFRPIKERIKNETPHN